MIISLFVLEMAPAYRELVRQVKSLIESVEGSGSKIREIEKSVSGIEAEKAEWTNANLNDPDVVRAISDRRIVHELQPKQLENIRALKGQQIEQLEKLLPALEREIVALRDAEQQRMIDKNCGGTVKKILRRR